MLRTTVAPVESADITEIVVLDMESMNVPPAGNAEFVPSPYQLVAVPDISSK